MLDFDNLVIASIFVSVFICVAANLFSSFIIISRDPKSREHQFFGIFFIGLGGYVVFYLFLQFPSLIEFSYPLQLLSISTLILGLTVFYQALANEGHVSNKKIVFGSISLYLIPIYCAVFHPYKIMEESYGFELNIEPWFMLVINFIYIIFAFYAIFGLISIWMRTHNTQIRQKLKLIFTGLIISFIFAFLFLVLIPIFLNIHYLKPVAYIGCTIGIIVMTYSFKKNKR